jgi:hypothetical protein
MKLTQCVYNLGYKLASEAFTQLQRHKSIEGMHIDNYIVNAVGDQLKNYDVRTHEMIDHPITYGIRMAQGSEELEKCIRRYLRDHPQEVFDMLRKSLKPVKVRGLIDTSLFCRTILVPRALLTRGATRGSGQIQNRIP